MGPGFWNQTRARVTTFTNCPHNVQFEFDIIIGRILYCHLGGTCITNSTLSEHHLLVSWFYSPYMLHQPVWYSFFVILALIFSFSLILVQFSHFPPVWEQIDNQRVDHFVLSRWLGEIRISCYFSHKNVTFRKMSLYQ